MMKVKKESILYHLKLFLDWEKPLKLELINTLNVTGKRAWTGPEYSVALPDTSGSSGLGKTLMTDPEALAYLMSTSYSAIRHFYSPTMSVKSGQTIETKLPKNEQPFVLVQFFDPEKGMVSDTGFVTDIIGENVVVELCGLPDYKGKFATVHFTETTEASRC